MARCCSKKEAVFWTVLVLLGILLWILGSVEVGEKFWKRRFMRTEEMERRKEVPFPDIFLCNQNPIDESVFLDMPLEVFRRLPYAEIPLFTTYLRVLATSPQRNVRDIPWYPEILERYKRFHSLLNFNKNGNISTVKDLFYSCKETVDSCQIGTVPLSREDCCNTSKIMASSKGICLVIQPRKWQKSPGLTEAFTVNVRVSRQKYYRQLTPRFSLYLHQRNVDAGGLREPIPLSNKTDYNIELELIEEEREGTWGCRKDHLIKHWRQVKGDNANRKAQEKMTEKMEKHRKCVGNVIEEKCGCHPFMSTLEWEEPGEGVGLDICDANQTLNCVNEMMEQHWVSQFDLPRIDKDDRRDALCPFPPLCLRQKWETTVDSRELLGGTVNDFQTKFTLYYPRMVVTVVTEKPSMDGLDLAHEVLFRGCIWFVIIRLLYMIVKGFQCCCTKHKQQQKTGQMEIPFPPMTDLVPEKYQGTQTDY